MSFRSLLVTACSAWALLSATAAERTPATRTLSLRECMEMALTRNLDIQLERLTSDIAGYNLTGAYGPYIPALAFRARHDYVSQPGDFSFSKFNPDQPYEWNADLLGAGLVGKLPFGFSYDMSAWGREDNVATDFRSNLEDARFFPGGIRKTNNYYSEARLDVQQHLLKDFWMDANRQLVLVRRKEVKMSEQALRFQVMKTVMAVELSYYDLVAGRDRVAVQQKAVELRQQLVNETRRRVQLGDLPPLDSDQAETELQNSLTALSLARETLLAQENVLKSLITDDFRTWLGVSLQPSDRLLVLPREIDRGASFQLALSTRPDLLEARLAVERSAVIVSYRKNQLFPNLDVVGRYGGLGVEPSPGPSFDNAIGFHNPEYFYGAVLSFPLSLSAERGNYRASKAARQISELQLKKAEQQVLFQIEDLINRVQSRLDQVNSTRRARAYAEAALAAEQKKLQNGISTSFIVLQLQETLTAARNAEVLALSDYNKIRAELEFAEGSILEKHGLSFR